MNLLNFTDSDPLGSMSPSGFGTLNANRKFHNCAPCAALAVLAADGQPQLHNAVGAVGDSYCEFRTNYSGEKDGVVTWKGVMDCGTNNPRDIVVIDNHGIWSIQNYPGTVQITSSSKYGVSGKWIPSMAKNATGYHNATTTTTNDWMKIALLIGAGYLFYKYILKK